MERHMLERTIIIPDRDNNGASLARERATIAYALLQLAGGYTADRVRGAWLGEDGTVYHDTSTRYTLAVTSEQDAAILARIPAWCGKLRQQCVYTSARAVDVAFIPSLTSESVAVN
jgi:hypothetical protein